MNSARIFASRNHIIEWINNLLKIEMTKIEQLGSGVIYCLLLDSVYPERVPISKLKWYANTQVDYIHNFKILQTSFCHLDIEKKIEINKLIKAKQQDNLDFIQWMKWFLEPKIGENDYNAIKRRENKEVYFDFCQHKILKIPQENSLKVRQKVSQQNKYSQKINKRLKKYYNTSDQFLQIFECRSEQSDNQMDCTDKYMGRVEKNKISKATQNIRASKHRFLTLQKYIDRSDEDQVHNNKENAYFSINKAIKVAEAQSSLQCLYSSPKQINKFYFPQRFSQRLKRRVDVVNGLRMSHATKLGFNGDKQKIQQKSNNIYIDELSDCQIQQ